LRSVPYNPAENELPQGLNESALEAAIVASGYPLQTVIALQLARTFGVTEEWGFMDRTTNEHRTLDIFAYQHVNGLDCPNKVCPTVALLIECKRAELPYVFFQSAVPKLPLDFPKITGLNRADIYIRDPKRSQDIPVSVALELAPHPFCTKPPICTTFSKAHRKGHDLNLSGTDVFNSVVLPLISAFEHLHASSEAGGGDIQFWAALSLSICVIDAPMVLVEGPPEALTLTLHPWVRLTRRETVEKNGRRYPQHYVIDVVQRGFFDTYISKELAQFADFYADQVNQYQKVLVQCRATVPNLDSWRSSELSPG